MPIAGITSSPASFQGPGALYGPAAAPATDRPSAGVRVQVSRPAGLQEAGQDEHAGGRGGEGSLQVDAVLPDPDQPADLHEEHGGDGPGRPGASCGNPEVMAVHERR